MNSDVDFVVISVKFAIQGKLFDEMAPFHRVHMTSSGDMLLGPACTCNKLMCLLVTDGPIVLPQASVCNLG